MFFPPRAWIVALAFFGASCNGAFDYPSPPPPGGELQGNAVVLRLQQSAVRFWLQRLPSVLRAHLPTRTHAGIERAGMPITEDPVGVLTLRDGCMGLVSSEACPERLDPADATLGVTYASRLELATTNLGANPTVRLFGPSGVNPARASVALSHLDVFVDVAALIQTTTASATCLVRDAAPGTAAMHLNSLSFNIGFEIAPSAALNVSVRDLAFELAAINNAHIAIAPCNGGVCQDPTCHPDGLALDCVGLCNALPFAGSFVDLTEDVLRPLLQAHLPRLLEQALNGGLAEQQSAFLTGSAALAIEDVFSVSPTLFAQPSVLELGLAPAAQPFEVSGATGSRGLSLALEGGVTTIPSHCAPTVSPPNYSLVSGPAPFFSGTLQLVDPVTQQTRSETYHAALSTSNAFVTQTFYALYAQGALCHTLLPQLAQDLSNATFAPALQMVASFAPEVTSLGPGEAPVAFQIHPTTAPQILLKQGDGSLRPQGIHTLDPYLHVNLGEMGLSAYALVDASWVRLFTVAGDVALDVDLVVTPANTVVLALREIDLQNLLLVYGELAQPEAVHPLALTVLRLSLGTVINGAPLLDLNLSEQAAQLVGDATVSTRINGLLRQGDESRGYLTTFITFCDAADRVNPSNIVCSR